MLIGRLFHASIDFGIGGFGSALGFVCDLIVEPKTQSVRLPLRMRFRKIINIAISFAEYLFHF